MQLNLIFILSTFFLSCTQNNGTYINNSFTDTTFVYWENLNENQRNDILNSENVNKEAIEFYKGKLKTGDNYQTTELLVTLSSISDKEKMTPFYFFLFNQICIKSDGALSEILGEYCQNTILSSPAYVVSYFIGNEEILKKYAEYLGFEMFFKEEGTSTIEYNYSDFKKILSDKIGSEKKYEAVLKLFYEEIEKSMKNME
jgi:hypothetical protein